MNLSPKYMKKEICFHHSLTQLDSLNAGRAGILSLVGVVVVIIHSKLDSLNAGRASILGLVGVVVTCEC